MQLIGALKPKNQADEDGNQEDDGYRIDAHQHHLVNGGAPFQAAALNRSDKGPIGRAGGEVVKPRKVTQQGQGVAADITQHRRHGWSERKIAKILDAPKGLN